MKREIISAQSYIEAFDDCIRRIENRKKSLDKKTVVIVPDKYTLYAERRLFTGGGAFDVEAVTFNRLLSKLGCHPKGYISRFGAVMLLRKLIGDGKDLKCFHRSAQFTGFADKLYDTIAQLNASDVTSEMLRTYNKTDAAFKAKIDDLILLREKYSNAVSGKYVDSSALLALLPDAVLSSDYLRNSTVYILNFDRLTAQHHRVIDAIEQCADYIGIYEVGLKTDTEFKKDKEICIYSAPDSETELKAVATRIRNDVYENGYSYGDFGIVTANPDFNSVSRVFSDYGIPFNLDKKYPMSDHPLSRFLFAALEAGDGRFSRGKLIRLAKNALTGISSEEASQFENYSNRRRVDYKGFLCEFSEEAPERVRKRLMDIIRPLENLTPFLRPSDFVQVLKELKATAASVDDLPVLTQAHDLISFSSKIDEVIDLMSEIMGDGVFPQPLLISTFKEGITSKEQTLLPAMRNSVTIGQPSLFRGQKFSRIFVLGFNEGVLPVTMKDCGIITDTEIDRLQNVGAKIEPRTTDVNVRAKSELLYLLDGCDRLFLSYIASDTGAPSSPLISLIKRYNKNIYISCSQIENERLYEGEDMLGLERAACCETAAAELLLDGLTRPRKSNCLSTLSLALGEKTHEILKEHDEDYTLSAPYDIFFKKKTVYISQIQTFFSCPYRHFLEYGLGLKEREDGSVSPKDVGIILHKVAELFVAAGDYDDFQKKASDIFAQLLCGELRDFADMPEMSLKRLKNECIRLCRTIALQMKRSRYESMGQEVLFSANDGAAIKAPSIELNNGEKLSVVGVIDRLDKCGNKIRIIDYKSGGIDGMLKSNMLYYGIKFQLQFYAAVLRRNGFDISGLFYFPISGDWADGDGYCRMKGIFDKDIAGIIDMDSSLADGGVSELFNVRLTRKKNGELSVGRNSLAYESDRLNAMCDYAERVFMSGAEDITDGYIRPVPYLSGNKSACSYCPYKTVCLNAQIYPRVLGRDKTESVTDKSAEEK